MNTKMNIPPYILPRIEGWHYSTKQKDTGKNKKFGENWFDLLEDGKLELCNEIKIDKIKDIHTFILVNMGKKDIQMKNTKTKDIYTIKSGEKNIVNNLHSEKFLHLTTVGKQKNKIHITMISNIYLALLQINDMIDIKDTAVYKDFLLMCGIPDKNQYIDSTGIESIQFYTKKDGVQDQSKHIIPELLIKQWKICHPYRSKRTKNPIPHKIQWIWLRRNIHSNEFGKLNRAFYKFMNTWIQRNKDFEFNIWTDNPNFYVPSQFRDTIVIKGPKDIQKLLNKLPEDIRKRIKFLYKNHENVGARSDVLRQAILYLEGGVYADVNDAVCLTNLEHFTDKFSFFIGMEPVMYVNNAIIGSRKRHPFIRNMLDFLSENAKEFVDEWNDEKDELEIEEKDDLIVSRTGPIAFTTCIFGYLNVKNVKNSLILPSSWIYPNYHTPLSPDKWLKPVSITAHYDRRDYLK